MRAARLLTWGCARWASLVAVALPGLGAMHGVARQPTAIGRFDLRRHAAAQVTLPHSLREVSGLAVGPRGELFTHGDERGVIQQIEPATGRVVRTIPIGTLPIRADLEGIAVARNRLLVVTSEGMLFEGGIDATGAVGSFRSTNTGLGRWCELEGMAFDAGRDLLLIGCKAPTRADGRADVTLLRWSLGAGRPATPDRITVRAGLVAQHTGANRFHPSSVEVDPVTGNYLLVAGRERALLELTPAGEVLAGARLPHSLHRQPEGLTFVGDSLLLIADEAAEGRPTLTTYRRVR